MKKKLLYILVLLVVGVAYYYGLIPLPDEQKHAEQHVDTSAAISAERLEIPQTPQGVSERILEKTNYTVSFNKKHNIPNWVAWHITADELVERESRTNDFQPDPQLSSRDAVTTQDYVGSGYDRGHMCPAADNRYHWKAMNECFYMTNMCPQDHHLNTGLWNDLEQQCRRMVSSRDGVYVVCGPILYDDATPPIYWPCT